MKQYFVYIVRCDDGSYYTGITNDARRRADEHNIGLDTHCYTYTRRPVELVYAADFSDVNDAIRWEKQIKGWSRRKKEALIADDWEAVRRNARTRASTALGCPSTGSG